MEIGGFTTPPFPRNCWPPEKSKYESRGTGKHFDLFYRFVKACHYFRLLNNKITGKIPSMRQQIICIVQMPFRGVFISKECKSNTIVKY